MTARYSWRQVLKELAGAQSTLARADVRHRPRRDAQLHDALVRKALLNIAEAARTVATLRRVSQLKAKTRRAA